MSLGEYPELKNIFSKNTSSEQRNLASRLVNSENSLLIKMKVKNKYEFIRNKLILSAILLIFPIILTIISMCHDKWVDTTDFFFGLLYIYDNKQENFLLYASFIYNHCETQKLNIEDQKLCDSYIFLQISGILSFILFVIAIIFNIISEIILILMIHWPLVLDELKSKRRIKIRLFSLLSLLFYFLGILLFFIICLSVKTQEERIAIDFYLALIGFLVYLGVVLFYWKMKRKLKRNLIIAKLLNPDTLLLRSEFGVNANR